MTVTVEVADLHAVDDHRPHDVAHASTPLGKTTVETATAIMTAKAAVTVIVPAVPILGLLPLSPYNSCFHVLIDYVATATVTRRMTVMTARGERMAQTVTRGKVRRGFPVVFVAAC